MAKISTFGGGFGAKSLPNPTSQDPYNPFVDQYLPAPYYPPWALTPSHIGMPNLHLNLPPLNSFPAIPPHAQPFFNQLSNPQMYKQQIPGVNWQPGDSSMGDWSTWMDNIPYSDPSLNPPPTPSWQQNYGSTTPSGSSWQQNYNYDPTISFPSSPSTPSFNYVPDGTFSGMNTYYPTPAPTYGFDPSGSWWSGAY